MDQIFHRNELYFKDDCKSKMNIIYTLCKHLHVFIMFLHSRETIQLCDLLSPVCLANQTHCNFVKAFLLNSQYQSICFQMAFVMMSTSGKCHQPIYRLHWSPRSCCRLLQSLNFLLCTRMSSHNTVINVSSL